MRNMSFAMTTEAIRNQTKTVTRRNGWDFLRPGDLVQPVVKTQGLKKGEHVEKIGCPIRIKSVTPFERLNKITPEECKKEGMRHVTPEQFILMYCMAHKRVGMRHYDFVTRIEFEYTDPTITDGYTTWSKRCPECGGLTMQVVRPGKVQCAVCG